MKKTYAPDPKVKSKKKSKWPDDFKGFGSNVAPKKRGKK